MKKIALLIIDSQNDFTNPKGSLYVNGAEKDVVNISSFIKRAKDEISYIALSLDSHQPVHIAHQCYWKDAEGNHPPLFTNIAAEEVELGKWIPQYNKEQALCYLQQLAQCGTKCTIWPMHCILGGEGWAVDPVLMQSLQDWAISTGCVYELFYKGYAQNTEYYSIFRAAVEWKDQPETHLNALLLAKLNEYDELILVGEAADFCVASSLNDIVTECPQLASKTVVFTDCMSWIIPENSSAKTIFENAGRQGVRFIESTDY